MQTARIPYTHEGTSLEAFVVYSSEKKTPTVILCHAWGGLDDYICQIAKEMAGLGYVVFVPDVYGKGVIGKSKEENLALKTPFLQNRPFLQKRLLKGLDVASALPYVDTKSLAAVGFGFGGLCALDLARSGADLKGTATIYGHFDVPANLPQKPILGKILLMHGNDDRISPLNELQDFVKTLSAAKVDWQAHIFGNTMHGFTSPIAKDPAYGILYNPTATKRVQLLIEGFLKEVMTP